MFSTFISWLHGWWKIWFHPAPVISLDDRRYLARLSLYKARSNEPYDPFTHGIY